MIMENKKNVSNEKDTKIMTTFLSRLIAAGVTIITLCATLMVTFVWDLRSDFATEKEKNNQTYQSVIEIKADVKEISNNVQESRMEVMLLKQNSARTEERLEGVEKKTPGRRN